MKKLYHVQLENGTYSHNSPTRENIKYNFYIIDENLMDAINKAIGGKEDRFYVVLAKELAGENCAIFENRLIL